MTREQANEAVRLLSWCVDTMRARIPEVLGSHPEGSQAAKLLADIGYALSSAVHNSEET